MQSVDKNQCKCLFKQSNDENMKADHYVKNIYHTHFKNNNNKIIFFD